MPKVLFGLSNENIDPSEYRDGLAASAKDCYQVAVGQDQHFRKRKGLSLFASASDMGATQGFYKSIKGPVVVVIFGTVYDLSVSGTLTAYTGDTLNGDTKCSFTEDFDNVFVAHGGRIAKLDVVAKTSTFLGSTAPGNATHIVYEQGFLLCNGLTAGGIIGDTNFSDDSTNGYATWESFNNERLPDGCTAIIGGWDAEVYSFGPRSIEVSYNDGTTPWAVLQGAYVQYGLLAPHSPIIADNTIIWLTEADGARRIVRMVDRAPSVISGPYDRLINSFETVSDARAWLQQIDGYSFYVITFPTEGRTFAFKIDDGSWSEFGFYNTDEATYDRYKGHDGIYIESWNKTLIGDHSDGIIYSQGGTTDNGNLVRFELTSGQNELGTFKTKKETLLHWRVKKGTSDGGTFEYRIRNNNKGWKNERSVSLGSLGDTDPYIKTTSGGVFRSRQYQIIHSDEDSDFIFMGLESDIVGTGR